MKKKLEYTGLSAKRTAVGGATPLLANSLQSNQLKVGNNGWELDEKTIGIGGEADEDGFSSTSFDVKFE